MSDATFEFNTDPVKAQQDQVKRRQAQEIAKRGLQQELQWTTEADLLQQEIRQKQVQMERRSADKMSRTMAAGQRRRLLESIARRGGTPGGNNLDIPGIGPIAQPELTNYKYNPATEKAPEAERGLKGFISGLSGASAAVGAFAAAVATAGSAAIAGQGTKAGNYQAYGDITVAVTRAARALRMNPQQLLGAVTSSPDQEGTLGLLDAMVSKFQRTGQRTTAGQLNASINAIRGGQYTAGQVTALAMNNQWSRLNMPGFDKGSFPGRFMDVRSARTSSEFSAIQPTSMEALENSMFYQSAWDSFKAQDPFWSSLPGAESSRYLTTTQEARDRRASFTSPESLRRSYDQTASSGTPQSPAIPQGIDTTTGGRSPATDATIQHMANTIRNAIQSRKPNPYGGGTEP
jgi:hypothetical protein